MTSAAPLREGRGREANEHEVARDLVRWALAAAGAKQAERIERIRVRMGPDTDLAPDELEFAVRLLTRWTIAEGAEVEVHRTREPGLAIDADAA